MQDFVNSEQGGELCSTLLHLAPNISTVWFHLIEVQELNSGFCGDGGGGNDQEGAWRNLLRRWEYSVSWAEGGYGVYVCVRIQGAQLSFVHLNVAKRLLWGFGNVRPVTFWWGRGDNTQGPRPWIGSPVGNQACIVPRPLWGLLLLKLPHPELRQQMFTAYI